MTQYAGALVLLVATVTAVLTVYALGLLVAVARTPLANPPYVAGVDPAEFAVSRFHARWYALRLTTTATDAAAPSVLRARGGSTRPPVGGLRHSS